VQLLDLESGWECLSLDLLNIRAPNNGSHVAIAELVREFELGGDYLLQSSLEHFVCLLAGCDELVNAVIVVLLCIIVV